MIRVRYYGHFDRRTGYGKAAEELALALLSTGAVELEIATSRHRAAEVHPQLRDYLHNTDELVGPLSSRPGFPDVVIFHTLPLDCVRAAVAEGLLIDQQDNPQALKAYARTSDATLIAYTTFEAVSIAPTEVHFALLPFDQVWVPSHQQADVLPFLAKGQCHVVPHSFDERRLVELNARSTHHDGDPDRFRFYYIGAWNQRKNVPGLIRAFARAFKREDPVELYLQIAGTPPGELMMALASTGVPQQHQPRIVSNVHQVPDLQLTELHVRYDCFVTATRAEGFNLPAFDALLANRMIIAQRELGSDDFLSYEPRSGKRAEWAPNRLEWASDWITGHRMAAIADVELEDGVNANTPSNKMLKVRKGLGVDVRAEWLEPDIHDLTKTLTSAAKDRKRTAWIDPNALNLIERFGRHATGKRALELLRQG
jgi:glycosyltransferase involved in cell wall biosynthesis